MIGLERRERSEQLARLLDGDLPSRDAHRDLRRLARLAERLQTTIDLPPLPAPSRDRIRERVLAEVQAAPAETAPRVARPASRSPRAAVATALAAALIGLSGVAVAAQNALPGDALYGVKKATETVRLAMASDLAEGGRLELAFARERLDEVTRGARRVAPAALIATLAEMDARSITGAQALIRAAERGSVPAYLREVATFLEHQERDLVALVDKLPPQVRPHAEHSLATLHHIRKELLAPHVADCDCLDVSAASLPDCAHCREAVAPGSGAERTTGGEAVTETRTATETGDDADTVTPDGSAEAEQLRSEVRREIRGTARESRSLARSLPEPLGSVARTLEEAASAVTDAVRSATQDGSGTATEVGDEPSGTLDDATGSLDLVPGS